MGTVSREGGARAVGWALFLSLVLTACGGGGGGGDGSSNSYNVVVTTSGLAGSGLVLQLNGSSNLSITAKGNATFSQQLASGANYSISIATQPASPTQSCTIANGSGTVGTGGVNATVTCVTSSFAIAATVSGLSGSGLVLTLNSANIPVSNNGVVALSSGLPSGTSYTVAVQSQPTSPWQTCTVGNASGTVGGGAVSNITVTCVATTYPMSVQISGLAGSGLVLQLNGSSNLAIDTIGTSTNTFATQVPSGGSYAITVLTQPSSPAQTCAASGGATGTVQNQGNSIIFVCTPLYYQWAWEGNGFRARTGAASWADSAGNLWLFGGLDQNLGSTLAGDLWKYTISTAAWTQVSAGGANMPAARQGAVSWTDTAANAWLFGGNGLGELNDLWKYNLTSSLWTQVSGSTTPGSVGVYGTQKVAATGNVPGGRDGAVSWMDSSGNLWLFGGNGFASSGAANLLNDLWMYNPTSGLWMWVSGSNATAAMGVYGTQGVAAGGNVPGARQGAASWIDSAGNLWLFGGSGLDSAGTSGSLNDLWKYAPAAGMWTWVGGSNVAGVYGVYGTQGLAAATNMPGGRAGASGQVDREGYFWLVGGSGLGSTASGNLNDLWRYNSTTGLWTWVTGSDKPGQPRQELGVGQYYVYASPPSSAYGVSWLDTNGQLWYLNSTEICMCLGNQPNYSDLWTFLLPSQ